MADARAPERERVALAAAWAGVAGALAYVAERVYERTRGLPVDPRLIVYDPHVSFYHRALSATWLAGVALGVAYAFLGTPRARARASLWLERSALPFVALLALAAYLLP